VDVRVAVEDDDALAELESLRDWLADVDDLRGRVVGVEIAPPAGALGPVLDTVLVAVGPGGAAAAFATALVSWMRHRRGAVKIRVEMPDGRSVRLDADHVQGLSVAELRALLDAVVGAVSPDGDGSDRDADEADSRE
jgi:hypothetical protein